MCGSHAAAHACGWSTAAPPSLPFHLPHSPPCAVHVSDPSDVACAFVQAPFLHSPGFMADYNKSKKQKTRQGGQSGWDKAVQEANQRKQDARDYEASLRAKQRAEEEMHLQARLELNSEQRDKEVEDILSSFGSVHSDMNFETALELSSEKGIDLFGSEIPPEMLELDDIDFSMFDSPAL